MQNLWTILNPADLVPMGGLLLILLTAAYVWLLFAFLHYRRGRQQELLHVVRTAVEAQLPLPAALRAYLADRPRGAMRETWVALLQFFLLPGYYWIWHRRHSYEHKVARVAQYVEDGCSLHDALRAVRGVASRDMLLATAIGEPTGRLAFCLETIRSSARNQLAGLWMEVLPRIVYPLVVLMVVCGVLTFWVTMIAPKFQRIFYDHGVPLPTATNWLIRYGHIVGHFWWAVEIPFVAVMVLSILLIASATFRWYFPGVGRLSRVLVQSRMLQAIAFLIKVDTPAPQALAQIAETGYFIRPARRRLRRAGRQVEEGASLADSLRRGGIVSAAMLPLVKAAERAGNLPWALGELAENLAQRTLRRARRLSLITFPVPIVALGLLVGFIMFAIFVPIISLLERIGQ
jgi:type IV pilus assembly protein PilC